MPHRPLLAVLVAVAAAALPGAAHAATTKAAPAQYYLSLGDSYSVGYQADVKRTTHNGFADQTVTLARKRGYDLTLENIGCGGATTTSILQQKGCAKAALAPGATPYDGATQIATAENFLKAHKGAVTLVTVSIGGNDVTACAREADPIPCVATAVAGIRKNVTALAKRLRAAGGAKVRIVGTTYPDVVLGEYVTGNQSLAKLSIVAFKSLINPALKAAYAAGGGSFVDVTAATGAYGSFDAMTTLAPYGSIPVPVATVCELSFYCSTPNHDIHLHTKGYAVIARLIAATLPRRKG